MIQVFKTDEEYVKWLDGQTLPSGIVVYVSDDETMYFSTNNIKGELKTYKCEKEEVIQYPPLVYSTNAAGSTITVNGETVTLGQGGNMVLEYPTAITSVAATNNTALTYIQIPNTVTSINDNAFDGCDALTDFNFNGTMEQWGAITLGDGWNLNAAFTVVHCTDGDVSLEEPIQPIQPNNLVYSTNAAGSTITVNGETVTLEQGENITLEYPTEITRVKATDNTALTAITIPNTMTGITGSAFRDCYYLTNINIPNTITDIYPQAFRSCINLINITIPENVKNIYDFAFMGCTKLTDFNYNGTMSQWASITLGTDWNFNSAFTVVHCSDGDVTL